MESLHRFVPWLVCDLASFHVLEQDLVVGRAHPPGVVVEKALPFPASLLPPWPAQVVSVMRINQLRKDASERWNEFYFY